MATLLIAMRLADMTVDHPEQREMPCSRCGEIVGVYPSGQALLTKEAGKLKVVCHVCGAPALTSGLSKIKIAPGGQREPLESVKRTRH